MTNKDRILQISKELGLSHIGSCLSVLPILELVYSAKKPADKVFLSGAHSHLAHLVVRESKLFDEDEYEKIGTGILEDVIRQYGIHCDRKAGCDFSGGSLGHLGIAVGAALANPEITVYAIITDGSFCEGSEMEALRIAKTLGVKNLVVHANFNSYTAVAKIDIDYYERIIQGLGFPVVVHRTDNGLPEFDGVKGHYLKYEEAVL